MEILNVPDIIKKVVPYYKDKEPETKNTLVYDSASEQLEPVYFFILDLMNDFGLILKKS